MLNEKEKKDIPLAEKILTFLRNHPNGVSNMDLESSVDAKNKEQFSEILNNLLDQNRIVAHDLNGEIVFRYQSQKDADKLKSLNMEENHTYTLITNSGNKGVTTNDIKDKTKLNTTVLNKILKKLEKNGLIKSYKVANVRNKKIWLGIDVTPSTDITGGIWCNNTQGFDKNLITAISNKVYDYIKNQKIATRKEILVFIKSSSLVTGELKEEDIQSILNLLVFDDRLEVIFPEIISLGGLNNKYNLLLRKNDQALNELKYKISYGYITKAKLDCYPCTFCPVFFECQKDNIINPRECPYLSEFLILPSEQDKK
jgi:DNA-directed RNA polymerase III subunit RPC6